MPAQRGLFTPVKVGPLDLPNRIVMSPMTRIRADEGCVPSERMVRYYSQRASAGLIITEVLVAVRKGATLAASWHPEHFFATNALHRTLRAFVAKKCSSPWRILAAILVPFFAAADTEGTHPSPMGRGYTYPPGLHTEEQAAGWRKVTDAVHAAGGRIFVQLMHAGRVSHSSLLPDHALPVAPSAIALTGEIHTFRGKVPFETPRPLETEEIPAVIEEYRRAAALSITARFDGVELHAATGYLPNQFQVTGSNHRTDAYGGSLEKRTRFTLEVVKALCDVRGADRVGIKIAPGFTVNDTFDDDPTETYTYLARSLNRLGLAYLHVGYDSGYGRGTAPPFNAIDLLRPVYAGTLLAVGGFNKVTGEAAIAAGRADAVVYARPFISNPDLVERLRLDAPLNPWDVQTFYGGDDHGYTDYPSLAEQGWPRKAP